MGTRRQSLAMSRGIVCKQSKMAPKYPDEVDVFTVPHSRMKQLVQKYFDMVSSTNFRDAVCMTNMLENLLHTFNEFKMHEQIENRFIMKRLKEKMNALHIRDAKVCNCHSDNRLTEMLTLVLEGYRCAQCSEQEREKYGHTLRQALEEFTQVFIPHMEEEEEVFQPMLVEYFTYDELKELKAKVIQKHLEKEYEKDSTATSDNDAPEKDDGQVQDRILPSEIMIKIFSYLSPIDLCRCAQVSKRWSELVMDPVLWPAIYPVHWASGDWSFKPLEKEDEEEALASQYEEYYCGDDEDADVDESTDANFNLDDEVRAEHKQAIREVQILSGLVKYVLPKVGTGVETCNLSHSCGLSSSLVHKVLKLCPNLLHLDLSHTKVMDTAFKEYGYKRGTGKLRHLDLTGCENITDLTLHSLAGIGIPPSDGLSPASASNNRIAWRAAGLCGRNCCMGAVKMGISDVDTIVMKPCSLHNGEVIVQKDPSLTDLAFLCDLECWQTFGLQCGNEGKGKKILISQERGTKKDALSCCSTTWHKKDKGQTAKRGTVCCESSCVQNSSGSCDLNETFNPAEGDSTTHALHNLIFLSLNSCFKITDEGLRALSKRGGLPSLQHLDLSGCLNISGLGVAALADTCHALDHAHLFYCDNMYPDPFPASASGCRNLQCSFRTCCRSGE